MKKTFLLLTLAAFLGAACAANGNSATEERPITLTFSNTGKEPADNTDGGDYSGIAFTLSSAPSRLDITCEGLTDIPSFSTFDLNSISVKVRSGQYSWADTAAYIIDDTTNTVLAHSTNTTGAVDGGTMAAFYFDSLTLNVNTGYKLIFVDASQINDDAIAVGTVMTDNYRKNRQLAAFSASAGAAECGFSGGIDGFSSTSYAPVVSIQGQVLIPEPTTTAFSLLALAGLAVRRRRG